MIYQTFCTRTKKNTELMAASSGSSSNNTGDDTFKWNSKSIKLLLDIRLSMEAEFNRPVCKKRKLWERVSREMESSGAYHVSESLCDSKYRNLLCTYRINKRRQKDTGDDNTPIKWEYFDIMDKILGTKASSCPPMETLGSSLDDRTPESDCERAPESLESDVEEASRQPKKKKVQREVSIKKYLFLKLEKDKEKDAEKAKKEEDRWKEKKELKQKEIDAINNLASAIGNTYKKSSTKENEEQ